MKKLMMAVMTAWMAATALADVSFSYSGQLRSETGGAVSVKNQTITFSLYNVATGGTALWSRMVPVQLDDNGYFAVELSNAVGSPVGIVVDLELVLANNAMLYVGLNVEGSSGEILPRQKLLSAPRAAFAEDVKTVKNGLTVSGAAVFVNGLQIGSGTSAKAEIKADGTIVAPKLQVPTISGNVSATGEVKAKNFTSTESVSAVTVSATTLDATTVKQGGNVLVPRGVIVMWSGAVNEVPAGWVLCNGQNGAPDLRDRFVVGAGSAYAVKATGGAASVALTESQMPIHKHHIGNGKDWWHCGVDDNTDYYFLSPRAWSGKKSPTGSGGHDSETNTDERGGGQAHENLPPYYALAFIMKL